MSLRTNRHAVYDLEYHLVVCTKFRHPVLVGSIRDRLIEITYSVIEGNYGCVISAVKMDADHIHIMFEAPPQVQLSKLVNSTQPVGAATNRHQGRYPSLDILIRAARGDCDTTGDRLIKMSYKF